MQDQARLARTQECRETSEQEAGHERIADAGDPCHIFDMRRMHSEDERGQERCRPICRKLLNNVKHKPGGKNVAGDVRQVPAGWLGAEERVVHLQPQKKKRTVVIPRRIGIDCGPDVGRKVSRHEIPTVNRGILEDLWNIVIDELEGKRCAT